jgi:GntP family gluconate:H+ symporter
MESYYPFVVLALGIVFIVGTIVVLRMHAFLALILAAILVGWLSGKPLPDDKPAEGRPQSVLALEVTTQEFGRTAGSIGVVILLASIIGKCLMDSGAADVITRRFLRLLGERFSSLALLGSGYVLSIPVFFDTVFYLLVPLAKAFRLRTGKNYVLYILAISAGGALTHSLVAPTPGPLIMAENLRIDLGVTILVGILFSIVPAILGGFLWASWVNSRVDIPLREIEGFSLSELEVIVNRPDHELPPFWLSMLPIVLPVVMITSGTIAGTLHQTSVAAGGAGLAEGVRALFQFVGNKNLALFVATAVAMYLVVRQKRLPLRELTTSFEPAIASAGVIILITSAGGAFGAMIGHAGVGDAISAQVPSDVSGTVLLLLAFGVTAVMKIAQGSGTVSMITGSAIMFGVIEGKVLPFDPFYIFLAIGFGSLVISWMNDSGFWIVTKMSGFTEKESLRTWTALLAVLGFLGLIEVLLFAWLLPFPL